MPPPKQEARHGEPFEQVLALKPRIEFGLAAGAAIVPDGQDARLLLGHRYLAATTMISTL
jgi:hypothetical protein